jgi:plasmid stability protein
MTLTIELTPEMERELRQVAARHGMSASDYARRLIEHHLPMPPEERKSLWEVLTPDEWVRQTRAWAESHQDWPVLPPGADDRASFYEGRE